MKNATKKCYICKEPIDITYQSSKDYFYIGRWKDNITTYFMVFHPDCFLEYAGEELYDEINNNFCPPLKKT